jgi:nicotinate-nucleotide adenylyltransferase
MRVGILGGTFDPIHDGHVAAAAAAQDALGLDTITLVPSHIPPHRHDPVGATGEQRFEMARLAAAEHSGWSVSRIELDRDGPSYTYDTLVTMNEDLSERRGDASARVAGSKIFFITGADAFAEIATWSRYPAVLDLANFVVVSRPGITLDSIRERVPSAFRNQPPCSPSDFHVRGNEKPRVILVEAHTPDISSTDIRRRVRAGQSLSGFVPDAVARFIAEHRLYSGN